MAEAITKPTRRGTNLGKRLPPIFLTIKLESSPAPIAAIPLVI
jgi:hypothetical protein